LCGGCVVEVVPGIVIPVNGDGGVVSDEEVIGGTTAANGAIVAVGGMTPNAVPPDRMTTRPVPPARSDRQRFKRPPSPACCCWFAA
jgi:hypothetical protein